MSDRINALTASYYLPESITVSEQLDNLTARIELIAPTPPPHPTFTIEELTSTIDRMMPLLDEPDLPNQLPTMGTPNSSNIAQYVYYPLQNSIIITFSNMVDYQYWDVTPLEFQNIIDGNATCVTKGQNQFGTWFIGKTPSVGAAVYRFLVQTNKPWRRL